MPVPVVNVLGKIVLPTGIGCPGGLIRVRLSSSGYVESTENETEVLEGLSTISIGRDGSVNFSLVPNALISPGGTFYRAQWTLADGFKFEEAWQLDELPSPLDIGDIRRVDGIAPAIITHTVDVVPDLVVLPAATAEWRFKMICIPGGANAEDRAFICLKGYDAVTTFRWIPWANGGGP